MKFTTISSNAKQIGNELKVLIVAYISKIHRKKEDQLVYLSVNPGDKVKKEKIITIIIHS
jgi:hypothetical protein